MGIDSIVRERHLLGHPFYRRWQKGKVPHSVLQGYARQYYHYEKELPSFIGSAIEHIDDEATRQALEKVKSDEASNPRPHAEIWLDFAAELGLSAEEVRSTEPTPRTNNLVGTYRSLTAHGPHEAIAALYTYESQVPDIAEEKANGLRNFYGVTSAEGLEFFTLHTTLDIEHSRALKQGLVDSDLAREAAHLAMDAWWGMLDQFEVLCENAA